MRTIIDLPQELVDALTRICEEEGISRAEAVRRAVADLVREKQEGRGAEAFGLWRDRQLDGRDYEDRLRDEWAELEGDPRHERSG